MSAAAKGLLKSALPLSVRELRLHMCQTSGESSSLREFVQSFYSSLKSANPALPILVREADGVTPTVYARYADGSEKSFETASLDKEQIATQLERIVVAAPP